MELARQHDGYAMAALLVAMSIMAVMMMVAMPTWQQMARREKEAELVFRGEQYARALMLFQARNGPGTAPGNFDVLVEQRFLRKKFKDPITNSDFVPISLAAGQPGAAPGTTQGAGGRGGAPTGGTQSAAQRGSAGATGGATPGATAAVGAVAGIMGVTSKSTEQSIRLYKGRSHYNEWQFTPVQRTAAAGQGGAGGQRGPSGVGGQRGQGGRGGNPPNPQNPFGGAGGAGAPGGGRANPPSPSNPNGVGQFPPARGNR